MPRRRARRVWSHAHQAGLALLHDGVGALRDASARDPGVARPERRVPRERQLLHRREDTDPVVGPRIGRRQHERGLGQVRPVREPLHLVAVESVGIEDDRDRVAPVRRGREHVDLAEWAQHPRKVLCPPMSLPLADVRVVAVEQYGAGPWGTLQLADLGADVIKIEDPRVGRRRRPLRAAVRAGRGLALLRDVQPQQALDLARPEVAGRTRRLREARRRLRRRLLEPARRPARATRPHLRAAPPPEPAHRVLLALGLRHDRAARGRGRLRLHVQGLAGWASLTGEPAGPPGKSALSLVDFSGGYVAAIAMLSGVLRARRDGAGCDCDLSLLRDGPRRAHLHRHVAGEPRVHAASGRAPRTPRWSRSRRSRRRTAAS